MEAINGHMISTATTEIIRQQLLEEIIQNVGVIDYYKDDLLQECNLILLEYNQPKIEQIYNNGDIKFFLSKIVTNQYNSKTSPFWKNYKKYDSLKDDIDKIIYDEDRDYSTGT